jgi:type VI secretion system protein
MAVTLRFQSTGTVPGSGAPVVMVGNNLTVGRGPENDLVLPDPDRLISKTHCVIEDHSGNVVVVDLSTNGTYLNYGKVALGRVATPLHDGDVLSLGTYELVVSISGSRPADPLASIAPPLDDAPVSHGQAGRAPDPLDLLDDAPPGGDFLDDLLGASSKPHGPSVIQRADPYDPLSLPPLGDEEDPLLGPAAPVAHKGASAPSHNPSVTDHFAPAGRSSAVIPDDWDDLLAPTPPRASPRAAPVVTPSLPVVQPPDPLDDLLTPAASAPEPPPPAPVVSEAPAATPPAVAPVPVAAAPVEALVTDAAPVAMGDQSAARAFLAAIGAAEVSVPDTELQPTMTRLGGVLKTMIEGLREVLMTRTSIKSEFRMNQTVIGSGRNNPLKFSISPEQAVEAMVRPVARGYLDAQAATEEALRDIKAHEVAMLSGMEAALKGVLKRLDPKALESRIDAGGGISGLLKGKKARYWEVYEQLYSEIADQAENDFHDLFAREFTKAYEAQLERLK